MTKHVGHVINSNLFIATNPDEAFNLVIFNYLKHNS